MPGEAELEVVGTYRFPHEASLAKTTLEAFGVDAWLLDEGESWHGAAALGGVKLAVRRADAATASEILAGDHSAALANVPEASLPPAPDELCRHCGSAALERAGRRTAMEALKAMFLGRAGGGWRCRSCGRTQ